MPTLMHMYKTHGLTFARPIVLVRYQVIWEELCFSGFQLRHEMERWHSVQGCDRRRGFVLIAEQTYIPVWYVSGSAKRKERYLTSQGQRSVYYRNWGSACIVHCNIKAYLCEILADPASSTWLQVSTQSRSDGKIRYLAVFRSSRLCDGGDTLAFCL